jgi:hypothetical protein
MYQGRCRGGPWDGKDLESVWRRHKVVIMPPLRIKYPPDYTPPDRLEQDQLKYGHYEHVLGQWVWHADR